MAERSPQSRREFLNLAPRFTPADEAAPSNAASPYLVQMKRRAMACDFELYLNAGQYPDATEKGLEAFDLIDLLEAQLTVYRDTSEVSQLNRTAFAGPQLVESGLFALLVRAKQLHSETGGAFDVTSGPLSKLWGFYRREGSIPAPAALAEVMTRVGSQFLDLDAGERTVRFAREGMELNLGSIGKGYALDRCDELMRAAGIDDFLWHGGQSSVWARGSSSSNQFGTPGWSVGVRHPLGSDRRLAEIRLCNRALATSGSSQQYFRHQGRRYGHILDPRTGWPAEGVLSATVLAPTAAEADALSTAFYVMGVEASLAYCEKRPEIGAMLLFASPSGTRIEMATVGLNPDDYRCHSDSFA